MHVQVNMLKRRDAEHGRISFVDIAVPDYNPEENAGISYEQVSGCEQARHTSVSNVPDAEPGAA